MSQPWPPPAYPPAPRRPGSIKTLAILNLVFGGLGIVGLVMTYAMYFGGLKMGANNPVVDAATSSPGYMTYLRWSLVSNAVGVALLATSGIGLLRLKTWGRKVTIGYALFGMAGAITGFIAVQHYLMGPLSHSSNAGATAGLMGGYAGGVMGLVYPIILLVYMMKQDVREAFERAAEPPIPPARVQ